MPVKPNFPVEFEMRSSTCHPPKPKHRPSTAMQVLLGPRKLTAPTATSLLSISGSSGLITVCITPDHESRQVPRRLAGSAPSRRTLETPRRGRQLFVVARGLLSAPAPPGLFGDSAYCPQPSINLFGVGELLTPGAKINSLHVVDTHLSDSPALVQFYRKCNWLRTGPIPTNYEGDLTKMDTTRPK